MTRIFKYILMTSSAFLVSGCASIAVPPKPQPTPTFQTEAIAPQQFFNAQGAPLPMASNWWAGFEEPALTALVEKALLANRQLDVAQANVAIATANLRRQKLETSYSTDSNASANIGRAAAPGRDILGTLGGSLGASWEYDAFGRIAATIKAAELGVEAAEQARLDVAVIVSSETALAYADLRGAQRRLAVARENAQTQAKSLDLLQELFDNGRATELDVARAKSQYRTTLADLPRFQAIIDAAISRLSALTGASAATPQEETLSLATDSAKIPALKTSFDIGSPAALIRRRPDIRAAEIDIAQLLALSDVERARLFPTLIFSADISALFGGSNRLDQLSSFGFGIGPSLRWDGPDLRRVRADIDVADAQTERAYKVYEQTVTQALSDVEIALSARLNERRRLQDLTLAAEAANTALEIATLRFEEGLDDFLDVLDAQRTLLTAQDRLAENQLQETRLTILAFRELGGI